MNPVLGQFVSQTRECFGPPKKPWREVLFPQLSDQEWLDTATLAGTSITDVLHAIHSGGITEADIDPQVLEAFHLQFPHVDNFVDFVQAHEDPEELRGIFSGLKGKLFELQHVDYLNHENLPDGYIAKLAESSVQPGYDIVIEGPNHEQVQFLQDKASSSADLIRTALSKYPDIDIYVPHQAATDLHDAGLSDHVFDSGIDGDALHQKTQAAITAADHVDGYHFPWLGEALVVMTEGYYLHQGKTNLSQFGKRTWRRGSRLFGSQLVGHAAAFATGHPAVHAISVPVRWIFARWDHSRDFSAATQSRLRRIRNISDSLSDQPQNRSRTRALAVASALTSRILE
jgi:hypothetical protein